MRFSQTVDYAIKQGIELIETVNYVYGTLGTFHSDVVLRDIREEWLEYQAQDWSFLSAENTEKICQIVMAWLGEESGILVLSGEAKFYKVPQVSWEHTDEYVRICDQLSSNYSRDGNDDAIAKLLRHYESIAGVVRNR